ncbi:sulfate permease [Euhalothece natronophila Z-M001]|uniref:Sulfate permease n=1 Tax=Euhalothece natronophila Z-M001 TaxID=522448 RepID=A0A5B8NRJ6_9CHRO|nr:sulfate permease [Euhalothece natronophila]QDZ40855.1 sulfate permease [Euhalothece natronophila Z-M001]
MNYLLRRYIPAVKWIPQYRPQYLVGDVTSGIIVTSLLIPQSMAYALLAGLPPQVGLYASILPAIIYPLLGTSAVLAVGPVAVDSLMVGTAISQFAVESTPEYMSLAITLAFLVGGIEILIGGLRLGFLVNFISRAVISGFISGAAVIIAFSQIRNLLGLQIPSTESFFELFVLLVRNLPETNLINLALGLASMGILFYFNNPLVKQLKRLGWSDQMILPVSKSAPLLVVILGTLLVWGLRLDEWANLQVVGEIPAGLPSLNLPNLNLETVELLLPAAIAIALVGYLEGFAGGQALASKRREKLDPNQELIALGAANWGSALSGGYTVTGGLSRSVVNFAAGANTGVASIITGLLIAVTAMFLTSLFYFLPATALAAIIIMAVYRLIEVGKLRRMWVYDKADAIAWLATFIIVLGLGVEQGILWGTLIALVFHLWRTSHPHIAIVGRLGESEHFRNVLRHPVKTHPEVLAVRVDESLYFANAKYLENFINSAIADNLEVKKVLLVCNAVNLIDASGLEILEGLVADLKSLGIELYLSEVKGPVMDKLKKIGFIDYLGKDHVFLTTDQAMRTLTTN